MRCASSLSARDTLVEIRDAPPTAPSTKPMRFLPSFLRIDIRGVDLAGLRYVNIDGTAVDAAHVRGRVRISPRTLRARDIDIQAPQFRLAGRALLRAGTYPTVSATGRWEDVSHYTQMVWPTTTHVGCAVHQGKTDEFLICRYSPPGNRDGMVIPVAWLR